VTLAGRDRSNGGARVIGRAFVLSVEPFQPAFRLPCHRTRAVAKKGVNHGEPEQTNSAMQQHEVDIVIIGGGPAGASAAIYAARAGHDVVVLDKGKAAGALGITHLIANYPGIVGEISGIELLERMHEQATSFGAKFVKTKVNGMFADEGDLNVYTTDGDSYKARALILATGSMGKTSSLPGEQELLGKGVSYCATCDAAFYKDRTAAVVGASEEAVEEALVLARFAKHVTLLVPRKELELPQDLLDELEHTPNMDVRLGAKVKAIIGEDNVKSVELTNGDSIEVEGAFLYLSGTKPITDYAATALDLDQGQCVVVDQDFQTALPGVYAVGDLLCRDIKQAVVAAAEGAVAALAADKYLTGSKRMRRDYA
jgi:thioredoxin reductase (NADPH)